MKNCSDKRVMVTCVMGTRRKRRSQRRWMDSTKCELTENVLSERRKTTLVGGPT